LAVKNLDSYDHFSNFASVSCFVVSDRTWGLYGIKPKDSLHVACAIKAKCKYFLTTDKILMKKAMKLKKIKAINPLEFITLLEEK